MAFASELLKNNEISLDAYRIVSSILERFRIFSNTQIHCVASAISSKTLCPQMVLFACKAAFKT
jgi:hypothetical protein